MGWLSRAALCRVRRTAAPGGGGGTRATALESTVAPRACLLLMWAASGDKEICENTLPTCLRSAPPTWCVHGKGMGRGSARADRDGAPALDIAARGVARQQGALPAVPRRHGGLLICRAVQNDAVARSEARLQAVCDEWAATLSPAALQSFH